MVRVGGSAMVGILIVDLVVAREPMTSPGPEKLESIPVTPYILAAGHFFD